MSILNKHLVFVNEQVGIQTRLAKKYANDQQRSELHLATRDSFIDLLASMSEADSLLDAAEPSRNQVQTPVLTLQPDELDGLPSEVLSELSEGAVPDKADAALLQVLADRGGIASLDQIIVGLYKKTGEIVKRNTLTSKLYRMGQKGAIYPVPERKGVYSARRLSEEEVRRLFGAEQSDSQQSLV
jgi:hypothetical protein